MLRIEIGTNESGDEVYVHKASLDADKFGIIEAIQVLYGAEGVISIAIYVEEEE